MREERGWGAWLGGLRITIAQTDQEQSQKEGKSIGEGLAKGDGYCRTNSFYARFHPRKRKGKGILAGKGVAMSPQRTVAIERMRTMTTE